MRREEDLRPSSVVVQQLDLEEHQKLEEEQQL
jgi:hypothetical protein